MVHFKRTPTVLAWPSPTPVELEIQTSCKASARHPTQELANNRHIVMSKAHVGVVITSCQWLSTLHPTSTAHIGSHEVIVNWSKVRPEHIQCFQRSNAAAPKRGPQVWWLIRTPGIYQRHLWVPVPWNLWKTWLLGSVPEAG